MILISCFAGLMLFVSRLKADDPKDEDPVRSFLHTIYPKNPCSSKDSSTVIISTIDGKVTALKAENGEFIWSIPSAAPLLSSSISSAKTPQELANIRFIPSLDGKLYQWTGNKLEAIPLSADYLIGQMERLPDGSYIIGGKDVAITGLDVNSGDSYYSCSSTGCHPVMKGDVPVINKRDILLMRRVQQTVRVIDPRTGAERWNFSVGSYGMEYVEGIQRDIPSDAFCGFNQVHADTNIKFQVQDGVMENFEGNDSLWKVKFDSPIVNAWKLENDSLKKIDIFKHGILDGLPDADIGPEPLMYMGVHEGQIYVQRSQDTDKRNTNPYDVFTENEKVTIIEQPGLQNWRPLVASSPSRTPAMVNDKSLSILNQMDYPFDNGFVLIPDTTKTQVQVHRNRRDAEKDFEDPQICEKYDINSFNYPQTCRRYNTNTEKSDNVVVDDGLMPMTLRDWWKEILLLSIVIAVGMNLGFKVLKRKLMAPKTLPLVSKPEPIMTRSKGSSVSIATETEMTLSEPASVPPTPTEFISSYLQDFEHMECLGKGGFGVVFKSKKKIDDFEYAVKRIFLPHCEEAKEKMMREVRALAALDHTGIVRYFHAWWEAPPAGWQYETDRKHLLKGLPQDPSFALSQDWLMEVDEEEEEAQPKSKHEKRKMKAAGERTRSNHSNDDPLGRRFNFDTGEESIFSDHSEFDLLKNNDVFMEDSKSSPMFSIDMNSSVDESEDESDSIVFEHSNSFSSRSNSFVGIQMSRSSSTVSDPAEKDNYKLDLSRFSYLIQGRDTDESENEELSHKGLKRTTTLTIDNVQDDSFIEFDPDSQSEIDFCNSESFKSRHSETTAKTAKTMLVGKCCNKSVDCLTLPPLFLYIQMQLCRRDTLKEWLKDNDLAQIDLKYRMEIFQQIVDAVVYFHGKGMMHRDLKPANIFFSLDGQVKVGDFGLVTAITRPCAGYKGKSFADENHTGQVGTQLYMSPEQVFGKPYSHKVDIYSLGLILFELLYAFSTQMERVQVIYKLKQAILPKEYQDSPEGNLVLLLLSENPDQRPEASEIKEHEFLKEITSR